MWKKLFYGASKRFANDAANIVTNEMKKKKNREVNHSTFDDDSETKERAVYLNQLRHILLENKEILSTINNDIMSRFSMMDDSFVDDEIMLEYQELVLDIQDIMIQKYDEAFKINDIGDQLSELTNDYTVYYKSRDVMLINEELIDLMNAISDMLIEDDIVYAGNVLNERLEQLNDIPRNIAEKIKKLYDEITQMNITTIVDSRGQRTIDYNE